MIRPTLPTILVAGLIAGSADASQTPAVRPTQAAIKPTGAGDKTPAKPSAPEGLPANIRIEVTISDQAGAGAVVKRSVSMLVADRRAGSVRSSGQAATTARDIVLNIDAIPTIIKDSLIRLDLTLEYAPKPSNETGAREGLVSLNQRLSVLVDAGKPTVVSQATDPTSDRKMSVEVTATVVK